VPGPFENVAEWWRWATALSDDEFGNIEEWCSANSLDHLADFIAEQWTLTMHRECSAPAVTEVHPKTVDEGSAALRLDSGTGQTSLGPAANEHAIDIPSPTITCHGSLIAAMESARKLGEMGRFSPVSGGDPH